MDYIGVFVAGVLIGYLLVILSGICDALAKQMQ